MWGFSCPRLVRAAAGLWWALATAAVAADAPADSIRGFMRVRPSAEARVMVESVLRSGDHVGRPFAVVDKKNARLFVFDAGGMLAGHTAALLGSTVGDHSVPGVGERAQTGSVRADERTTPAGRFDSVPGVNLSGEPVVWVDYATAFAIHRLRPGKSHALRAQRLATMSPDDNRVSLGCVIVPVDFYEQVVQPVLGRSRSVVYVLPESQLGREMFGAL